MSHRQNIRNGFFCESAETVLAEIKHRIEIKDTEAVKVLRELLDEMLDEMSVWG